MNRNIIILIILIGVNNLGLANLNDKCRKFRYTFTPTTSESINERNIVMSTKKLCDYPDCKNLDYFYGYCRKHYVPQKKYVVGGNSVKTLYRKEFLTWLRIKRRCYKLDDPYYKGKGIKVCERWLGEDGFKNFLEDMGEKSEGRWVDIDRIDSNKNYEPNNCRWLTRKEHRRKQTTKLNMEVAQDIRNIKLLFPKIKTIEIANVYGVSCSMINNIIRNKYWATK